MFGSIDLTTSRDHFLILKSKISYKYIAIIATVHSSSRLNIYNYLEKYTVPLDYCHIFF